MAIRTQVEWCNESKEFSGLVTYARKDLRLRDDAMNDANNDSIQVENDTNENGKKSTIPKTVAKFALVFMINGINDFIQLPIAYYFVNSTVGSDKKYLIKQIIQQITDCDVEVCNITFDGFSSNTKMCSLPGADVANEDASKIKPYFTLNDSKVYVIYDPSHMIKLVRNVLGKQKVLYDGENGKIEWKYVESLYKFSIQNNVTYGHKITKEHIEYTHNKMKVKLATQLLSNSVAETIQKLMDRGIPEFQGAEATIKFLKNFNNLFDIMNTRHKNYQHENIFKRPISALNKNEVFAFCDEMVLYISKLKFSTSQKSPYIINTDSKCGFRGFITNIKSVQAMFAKYVDEGEGADLLSLPTFHFSQDFLELLFGRIRSMGGFNDNPTAVQFKAAYRKLVCHSKIVTSNKGNVDDICSKAMETDILTISSRGKPFFTSETEENLREELEQNRECFDQNIDKYMHDQSTNELYDGNIANIARNIEDKINKLGFFCDNCEKVFEQDEKISSVICSQQPCQTTFEICKRVDVILEANASKIIEPMFSFRSLHVCIFEKIDENVENYFPQTTFVTEEHESHKIYIIRFIVDEFVKTKCKQLAKQKSKI